MGLFDSLETTPTQPMQAAQPAPPPERVPTTARPRTATGSVRDPAGSTLPSGLVEATRVAPGRQVTSEIQRRTRRQTEG